MLGKKLRERVIVGLDIGTTKVVALVGVWKQDDQLEIMGIGTCPSRGLKRGVVINIESTVDSIRKVLEDVERMADCKVGMVYAGIAGAHINSLNSHGIVAIRDDEVTALDVDRVIDAAKAVAIPSDQKILHVLCQEFIVDHQHSIREPLGMAGVRLEAKVHIVTGSVSTAQNIVKCVEQCGVQVADIVLEQLASSYAVLTDDERELGVCMIDIGGGTTDVALFVDGAIQHTSVVPIAGDQVTNDIAIALRISTQQAEDIKKQYACALQSLVGMDEHIQIPGVHPPKGRACSRHLLAQVVEARYEELFQLVLDKLKRSGCIHQMPAGVVLTGGASQVQGGIELAEKVFDMPVRLGIPHAVGGLPDIANSPMYATSVGLLLAGCRQFYDFKRSSFHNDVETIWSRMRRWFRHNF